MIDMHGEVPLAAVDDLGAAVPARARRRLKPSLASTLFLSGVVVFLAVWQIGSSAGFLAEDFFGSPSGVVSEGVNLMGTSAFWNDAWVSLREFLWGYGAGILIGIPFGILLGYYRPVQFFFDPLLNAMNATPRIAITPLIILWLGFGLRSKTVVIAIGVFVTLVMNIFDGLRTVERGLLDVPQVYGASALYRARTVILPGSLPFVITGMRLAVGHGVAGVLITEYFQSSSGIGFLIFQAADNLRTNRLIFGVVIVTTAAVIGFNILSKVERRLDRWRPARAV